MVISKEFFLTVTQRLFSNWTALKLAVEHDMGPKESAAEFCTYTTEVLYMNDELNISEVATVLEDYMADCFNTEMEDGSAAEVAEVLLKFYRYCLEGNETTARTELEKLPPLQPWLSVLQPVRNNNYVTANRDSSSSSEEDMDTDNMDTKEVAEEGWTKVRSGRRR
ncbi:PREDICTED: uncharacterized protein LOC106747697 [Dinoponera quadriceps]|uniref:Pre-rRNA-processing protein TSR2 homolog n=1 Tax=Dinoponera quadriceps TaxID=609295 RepID=A0A6P3XRE7_DINQU|nr:PREDICTED: uncharacterized protein LOC106747697 [Dinoponera quadriceps]